MHTFTLLRETDQDYDAAPERLPERMEEILSGLNEPQRTAASAADGPLMIVAGAGSGKTRTLTFRIAWLIASGKAHPYQILALTFTNKAAREMKERVIDLLGEEEAAGIWMGTFHSILARILRREAEHLGYTRDFSIYDREDSERAVGGILNRLGIDRKQFTPRSILSRISTAKNMLLSPDAFRRGARSVHDEKAALVYGPYEDALRRSNALDFDDLLIKPIVLFRQHSGIHRQYQDRWKYILIDEYQDTNHAQYVLAKMLAEKNKNLCVVGDDAQCIYAFRWADIRNILSFQADYPDTTVVRLERNYRSSANILRFADSVIRNNKDQIEKKLWTSKDEGSPVVLMECLSERDEAQKVEATIRDLHAREGLPFRSFAVLYRTNAQSRSLEDALRREGVPYQIVGGINFYQRREIKDALAYLRLTVNPNDAQSLLRVVNYPRRGIGKKTVERLREFAGESRISLWEAICAPEKTGLSLRVRNALAGFREMISGYGEIVEKQPADEVAGRLIQEAGILVELRRENTVESLARWENVQELLNAIAEFREQAERAGASSTLSAFLQDVSLITDADTQEDDDNRVTLMTLHASKGLEFPVVFVTGLEEGLFPLASASREQADLEEERRLFYVGATRAERHLFLTTARSRFRYGRHEESVRSRFLEEIDGAVVRTEGGRRFETKRKSAQTHRRKARKHFDLDMDASGLSAKDFGADSEGGRGDHRIVYDEGEGGEIRPGIEVEHQQFGEGKVLSIDGEGVHARAVVFFPSVGQKKLVLRFARLRRIG